MISELEQAIQELESSQRELVAENPEDFAALEQRRNIVPKRCGRCWPLWQTGRRARPNSRACSGFILEAT